MAYFAVIWKYVKNPDLIASVRTPHVDYLKGLFAKKQLLEAGAWLDGSGALLVFEVEDRATLAKLLEDDPFTPAGVITETAIHDWNPVFGAFKK
jgi:uncharacterized protein YciI